MKKPIGLSFEIGCAEKRIGLKKSRKWFCYFSKQKLLHIRPTLNGINAKHGGLKIDINIGTLRRPIPKFWKKEFWSRDYMTQEPFTNPWNSGNHWFVLTIPLFIGIFISICYGAGERQPGFYIGCKTYEVNEISQGLGKYDAGNPENYLHKYPYPENVAWGKTNEVGNIYLCPSASLRDDLVD